MTPDRGSGALTVTYISVSVRSMIVIEHVVFVATRPDVSGQHVRDGFGRIQLRVSDCLAIGRKIDRQFRNDVCVLVRYGNDQHGMSSAQQAFCDRCCRAESCRSRDSHRFGVSDSMTLAQPAMLVQWWRITIVSAGVNAVIAIPEPALISRKPRAVGADIDAPPGFSGGRPNSG